MSSEKWVRRTHMTSEVFTEPRLPNYRPFAKPTGFWYQIGREWERLAETTLTYKLGNRLVVVEVNHTRLIHLRNREDILKFSRKYTTDGCGGLVGFLDHSWDWERPGGEDGFYGLRIYLDLIDWLLVAKDYAGVELRLPVAGWDVPSGCVWDLSAVRILKAVRRRPLTIRESEMQHAS